MTEFNQWRGIVRGITLAILLAVVVLAVLAVLIATLQSLRLPATNNWAFSTVIVLSAALYFIAVTQLLYIIPLLIFLWREQRFALMKGVEIGAIVVGLINGGYLLYLMNRFR